MTTKPDRPPCERPVHLLRSFGERRGRTPKRAVLRNAFLVMCGVLALGCSGSSPTDPTQNLVLEGDLEYQGRQFHPVTPGRDGVLRIEVAELTPLLVQVGDNTAPVLSVGVGLGRPVEEFCVVSASFALAVGGKLSFSLNDGEYCVQIFDTGTLPPDATIHYVVLADVS